MPDQLMKLLASHDEILEHLDNSRLIREAAKTFVNDCELADEAKRQAIVAGFLGGALFIIQSITMTDNDDILTSARQSLLREIQEINAG